MFKVLAFLALIATSVGQTAEETPKALSTEVPAGSTEASPTQAGEGTDAASNAADVEEANKYKEIACGFQCVSMCERVTSPNCIDNCKTLFCSSETQAFTSPAVELTAQTQSWTSWLLGNLFVVGAFAGIGFWAKKRLYNSKKSSRRMRRKVNDVSLDTYYKL